MDKRVGGVKEEIFSGHKKIDGKNMENLEIFINIPFVARTTDRQTKCCKVDAYWSEVTKCIIPFIKHLATIFLNSFCARALF